MLPQRILTFCYGRMSETWSDLVGRTWLDLVGFGQTVGFTQILTSGKFGWLRSALVGFGQIWSVLVVVVSGGDLYIGAVFISQPRKTCKKSYKQGDMGILALE